MAIVAGPIYFVPWMFEFLSVWCQQIEFVAAALGEDGVARVAIARLDAALAVGAYVFAVVAAETAGPDHVADVVGVFVPLRLHLRKKVVTVNLLHHVNGLANALLLRGKFVRRVTLGQNRRNALQREGLVR